jgi:2-oxopent-4-enoate/cis-2-oxohex-4-enoate hydratase
VDERVIRSLGDELFAALRSRSTVTPLTERYPEITVDDAYRISAHLLKLRTNDHERVIGKKIGLTSPAVQEMFGVHQPDVGFLTDAMAYGDGATLSLSRIGLIQPRAEGEIAFVLARDLARTNVTRDEVMAATEAVIPCFEIVDSRIRDWKIKIQDTIADNASCGAFVLGNTPVKPGAIDLASARLSMVRKRPASGQRARLCRARSSGRSGCLAGKHAGPLRRPAAQRRDYPFRFARAAHPSDLRRLLRAHAPRHRRRLG